MTEIELDQPIWAVIVTVDSDPETMTVLVQHASMGLERFPSFVGFISGALHVSTDGTRLVQYLRWRSEVEYRACRDDPVWDSQPTTAAFMDALKTGKATLDERTFTVVATAQAAE